MSQRRSETDKKKKAIRQIIPGGAALSCGLPFCQVAQWRDGRTPGQLIKVRCGWMPGVTHDPCPPPTHRPPSKTPTQHTHTQIQHILFISFSLFHGISLPVCVWLLQFSGGASVSKTLLPAHKYTCTISAHPPTDFHRPAHTHSRGSICFVCSYINHKKWGSAPCFHFEEFIIFILWSGWVSYVQKFKEQTPRPPSSISQVFFQQDVKQWAPPSLVTSKFANHLPCSSLNLVRWQFCLKRSLKKTADLEASCHHFKSHQAQCSPPHFLYKL